MYRWKKQEIIEILDCRRQGRRKGDAPQARRYPIFVTLSLWVECSRDGSHSILALLSKVTNIGYLLAWGAVCWLLM